MKKFTQEKKPFVKNDKVKNEKIVEKKPIEKVFSPQPPIDELEDRLEGRNPIIEALTAGRTFDKILVAKGDREGSILRILAMAKEKGIMIQEVDRSKLDGMSVTHAHQGVIAHVAMHHYVTIDEMLQNAKQNGEVPFLIMVDEVTDPHNLGSILRSANAAGAHGVIIPKRRAVGLTASVAKASAGAVEYMPVAKVVNLSQTIEQLKEQGVWVIAADMDGEQTYTDADLTGAICLVVGSEGEGIGQLIKKNCDFVVSIPMLGQISSLNASVAGALMMYEVVRQRNITKK
ncbi:MAG: 23S rRNA (guanosine(2251)-2'-O)-methyltransferase RlmB [Hyphomonadaceae bacterium]|nr:23S rRNA (guanosine(2251)-2'-O)-methyltransferase RlmB [Clostridia bacterium]